jgi:hypothetical protein
MSELDFHTMHGFQIIAERVAHILSHNQLRSLDGIVSKVESAFKDVFHLVIVIPIQTTNLLRFFRPLQLSPDKAVLRTVARCNA